MSKVNVLGFSMPQMEELLTSLGAQSFHGRQVFKWIYSSREYEFSRMTDLSRDMRVQLAERCTVDQLKLEGNFHSKDGTRKLLFRLHDGHPVESVLIPDEDDKRQTACISVQAGCAVKCAFCATGTMGLLRDLTSGEIVAQLMQLRDEFGSDAFSNIVMMGMGEPLLNFESVVEALRIITSDVGLGVSPKRITLSTSGITPKIKKLAETGLNVRLAISLHAATQQKRLRIMPIAKTFSLTKLIEAARYYAQETGLPVTFEYILFDGFNDKPEDIEQLSRLVSGFACKINILAYNPVPGLPFERPSDDKVNRFARQLHQAGVTVTVRKSRGRDIDAACGQLAARNVNRSQMK
jgi:23S rRNA (adenine2503-C2)-methyltransferase